MNVKIIRSPTRKKTIQANMTEGNLVVRVPLGMDPKAEEKIIEQMKQKFEKKQLKTRINNDHHLSRQFDRFNDKYFQNKLEVSSIKFVTNQDKRNGSCTPDYKTIRISHKLLNMPDWVLDYVIMHEMTHLVYPDHSKAFWKKVGEYKYAERARGFLIAKGLEDSDISNESDL